MRCSDLYMPTLREAPSELTAPSTVFLFRAGMMRRVAGGLYGFLPLGLRVLHRLRGLVRDALQGAGALEAGLPLHDRGREELLASIVGGDVSGFRSLPLTLYDMGPMVRPEAGTRPGLSHSRQQLFVSGMSFNTSAHSAGEAVGRLDEAVRGLLARLGLDCRSIGGVTDGPARGGEHLALSENGESVLVCCPLCGNVGRRESAPCGPRVAGDPEQLSEGGRRGRVREVPTPGMRTIAEVSQFLTVPPQRMCKTLIYLCDDRPVVVFVRGDHALSEPKLSSLLDCRGLELADERVVKEVTGAPVGFAGPVGLPSGVPVYADQALQGLMDGVAGANREGAHIMHVSAERDFPRRTQYADLRQAAAGDLCADCRRGVYSESRAFSVARLSTFDTSLSAEWGLKVLDSSGVPRSLHLCGFEIEIGALLTAVAEQKADEHGIVWPAAIAPFHVIICPIGGSDGVRRAAETLYEELVDEGLDVLLDDRGERAGVMFNDADLLGIPVRVTVGDRSLAEDLVEIKGRAEREKRQIGVGDARVAVRRMLELEPSASPGG